ncbi:MAG: hypothetical protein U1F22_01990 [Lysobacterales bacterium]
MSPQRSTPPAARRRPQGRRLAALGLALLGLLDGGAALAQSMSAAVGVQIVLDERSVESIRAWRRAQGLDPAPAGTAQTTTADARQRQQQRFAAAPLPPRLRDLPHLAGGS